MPNISDITTQIITMKVVYFIHLLIISSTLLNVEGKVYWIFNAYSLFPQFLCFGVYVMIACGKTRPYERLMPLCCFIEVILTFMLAMEIFLECLDQFFTPNPWGKLLALAISAGFIVAWGYFFTACYEAVGFKAEAAQRVGQRDSCCPCLKKRPTVRGPRASSAAGGVQRSESLIAPAEPGPGGLAVPGGGGNSVYNYQAINASVNDSVAIEEESPGQQSSLLQSLAQERDRNRKNSRKDTNRHYQDSAAPTRTDSARQPAGAPVNGDASNSLDDLTEEERAWLGLK